jgi:hypothetical protein
MCVGGAAGGLENIQLRVPAPISGSLTLRQGGSTLFRKSISARPERRILIPLAKLKLRADAGDITIGIARAGG